MYTATIYLPGDYGKPQTVLLNATTLSECKAWAERLAGDLLEVEEHYLDRQNPGSRYTRLWHHYVYHRDKQTGFKKVSSDVFADYVYDGVVCGHCRRLNRDGVGEICSLCVPIIHPNGAFDYTDKELEWNSLRGDHLGL